MATGKSLAPNRISPTASKNMLTHVKAKSIEIYNSTAMGLLKQTLNKSKKHGGLKNVKNK